MKKKIITSVIALAFSAGSVYANTSGTEIGSATQTITLPVVLAPLFPDRGCILS